MGRGASQWFGINTETLESLSPLSPEDALQHYTGGNLTMTGPKETASIFAT